MAALPRPSRPSLNPPSAPLPSIPIPKSRQTSTTSIERSPSSLSPNPPGSSLPQPASRSLSSTSIPTIANGTSAAAMNSTAATSSNSIHAPATASPVGQVLQQEKPVRRQISYNSFPKPPPNGLRSPSNPPSGTTTPRAPSSRTSSLVNAPIRSPSATPSLRMATLSGPESSINHSSAPSVASFDDSKSLKAEKLDVLDDESRRGRPASTVGGVGGKDKGNVVVSVRVRPEAGAVNGEGPNADEWSVEGRQGLIAYKGKDGGSYYYDNVFTTNDKNARVYDSAAKRLVRRVMDGYHGTVFAYGMTGTGKTFSMQGTATSPGVIPLAITDIFSFIRETPHREFLLRVSYLEIYNERIHDLLATPLGGAGQGVQQTEEIKLREDSKRGVYATPLKEEIVQSPTQLLRVIARGDHARRTSSTQFNARSSRSHAVVQIVVESRERNAGGKAVQEDKRAPVVPGGVRVSTLSLIDLAGSERAADSKERQKEGAHINKSLLTLGTVISKLSGKKDKQGNLTDKEGKHLPYRDSKLTRLLQPALSGNSLISILCTVQVGAAGSTMETLNTLKFAARARNNITSHAKKAEEAHGNIGDAGSRALLDRYRLEILDLRKQLESQKLEAEKAQKEHREESQKQDQQEAEPEAEDAEKAVEAGQDDRHEEQMLEMQLARTALKERIEHLNRLILSSRSVGVNSGRPFPRESTMSASTYSRSIRSSASTYTMDPSEYGGGKRTSTSTMATFRNHDSMAPSEAGGAFDEEDDSYGDGGDGTASLAAQVRALQADLADKTRYIQTLEKRLIQARRSSRSRVSMTFRQPLPTEEGGVEALVAAKDQEIAELRERLDDKDRMVAALRSAARKRDTADTSITNISSLSISEHPSPDLDGERPSKRDGRSSRGSSVGPNERQRRRQSIDSWRPTAGTGASGVASSRQSGGRTGAGDTSASHPTSPTGADGNKILQLGTTATARETNGAAAATSATRAGHGMDAMQRMLDEMLRQRPDHNNSNGSTRNRGSSTLGPSTNGVSTSPPTPTSASSTGPPSSFPVNVNARTGKRNSNTRLSTDGSRLSGWEQGVSTRRRQSGPQGNGTTRSQRSSGTAYSSGGDGTTVTTDGNRLTPPTPGSISTSFNMASKDKVDSYFKPSAASVNGSIPTSPSEYPAAHTKQSSDPMFNSTAAAFEATQALSRNRGPSNPDSYTPPTQASVETFNATTSSSSSFPTDKSGSARTAAPTSTMHTGDSEEAVKAAATAAAATAAAIHA